MAALIRPLQEPIGPAASGTQRTERSHAFQRAWAAIPRDSSIPDKTDFRPERFASFLADIYLVELHTEAYRRVLFRQLIQFLCGNPPGSSSGSDPVPVFW